ncbi:MAG: thiol peroxidase [Phycisphaerales bacterium]|nr:thiol peroxidase [Phycisphaerales bacterium]
MRGKPVTLEGQAVAVGRPAPDFTAVANDLSEKKLSDWRGRTVILSTVPSLDTAVCDKETRTFNQRAAGLGDGVVVLTVSMDLPFAQKRWCGAAGIDRVVTLSDFKRREVGERYGLRMAENGLLARAVTVIDPRGVVRYQQIVGEVASEPDYDAAVEAARAAAGK